MQTTNESLMQLETFASLDDVVDERVVDDRSALAQSPVLAVERDRRQTALEAGRSPAPAAAPPVPVRRRQPADVQRVAAGQVEMDRARVGQLVDARAPVHHQSLAAHGRPLDRHRVPGVVVERRRRPSPVGQHADAAADVEHVADAAGRQLD